MAQALVRGQNPSQQRRSPRFDPRPPTDTVRLTFNTLRKCACLIRWGTRFRQFSTVSVSDGTSDWTLPYLDTGCGGVDE